MEVLADARVVRGGDHVRVPAAHDAWARTSGFAAAILFAVFALVLYVPAGYYIELFLYRRRQRKQGGRQMIDVRMFTVGPVQENCFIVRRSEAPNARCRRSRATRPTGSSRRSTRSEITTVDAILLTHTHFDHIGAVAPVARATGAPVYCPELETEVLANIMDFVPWPGFGPFESYDADHTVAGGETLELAGLTIDVIFTPGHSPGHVTYAIRGRGRAVLRRRAVPGLGRPRRPAGRRLADAAGARSRSLLDTFTPRRRSIPGHMGITTLGRERATNPFLRELAGR